MEYTFISGATGGIGKAFAIACAKKGNPLYLTGRSIEKLNALKDELQRDYKVTIEVFPALLYDEKSRANLVLNAKNKQLTFNRIINVAGVDTQKAFSEYSESDIISQIRVNAEAVISLTSEFIKLRGKTLEIITISSMSGIMPMPYFALYSASKSMITNFFTALRYEYKKSGVKITTVLPGAVPTRPDIIKEIKSQGFWGKISSKSPEFVAEKSLKAVSKNKAKYIPGFFNKFLNFVMHVAPKRIVLSFIAKRWRTHKKDAFCERGEEK